MIHLEAFPTPQGLLDLRAEKGDIILLKGGNGAGKTSLLRALAGLDAPRAPRLVHVEGRPPALLDAPTLARTLAFSPQDARDALVGLTLEGEARLRGRPTPPRLAPLAGREIATLSSGEARRAALAFCDAPVLLLDEPAEGLDAEGRALLVDAVRRAAVRGCVVAADHAGILESLATRVVHLDAAGHEPLDPIPHAEGGLVLESAPVRIRDLRLPGVRLGPGFHALCGPNGAGKSTLLLHLAGLDAPKDVRVAGGPPRPGRNVRVAPPHAKDALTRERVADELAAAEPEIIAQLVPPALHARHPLTLSGGEAQRVLLAKVLGAPAPVYLLDEPEAHLDAQGRRALRDAVASRLAEGACVVAATHDPALLALAHARIEVTR